MCFITQIINFIKERFAFNCLHLDIVWTSVRTTAHNIITFEDFILELILKSIDWNVSRNKLAQNVGHVLHIDDYKRPNVCVVGYVGADQLCARSSVVTALCSSMSPLRSRLPLQEM